MVDEGPNLLELVAAAGFKLVTDKFAPKGMVIFSSDTQVVTLHKGECEVFKDDELFQLYVDSLAATVEKADRDV